MNWEGVAALAAIAGVVFTVAGFVFSFGKLTARFESMEVRTKEDRESNGAQHNEFYDTARCVSGMEVNIDNLSKSLDELKVDVREVLNRVRGIS